MKIGPPRLRALPEGELPPPKGRGRRTAGLIIAALVLLAAFVIAVPYLPPILKDVSNLFSGLQLGDHGTTQKSSQSSLNYTLYSPLIQNGSAKISYPPDYTTLASYALGQINNDRATFGLGAVTLSTNLAGQQHADSMLNYGYFSHYDTQGFKPYMRYTLLGGRGAVEENVAYIYNYPPHFTSTSELETAIKTLEHSMMYNDSTCCNNGHRDNILTSLHNAVSIGVAYNGTSIYFVEDFENYYVNLKFSVSSAYYVTMTGVPIQSGLNPNAIYVTYDSTPAAETPAQLSAGPHEYGPGTLIGGILPPCTINCQAFQRGITSYADTWKFTTSQVDITFSLHDFIANYGAGVYTLYLVTGSDTSSGITSISVFVAHS